MPTRDLAKLQTGIWKTINRIEDAYTRELFVNYKIALDDVRVELSKVYEKYSKAGALTHAEMSKFNRLDKLHEQLSDILGPTLSRNGRLVEDLRKVQYQESFYRNAWALDQSSGVSLRWGLLSEKTIEAAVKDDTFAGLLKIAKENVKTDAMFGIRRTITQGLIRGESYPKMAREIKDFIERSASGYVRIVRTEGQRAAVNGQLTNYDAARDLGVQVRNIWDATLDKATRPDHGAMDGQVANEEGYFDTPVGLQRGPMQSGYAWWDISCRCRVRGQIEGYEPTVRRIRDEEIQPYQTYSEWAKEKGLKTKLPNRKVYMD